MLQQGIIEFIDSDGLAPLVKEKLNHNFRALNSGSVSQTTKANAAIVETTSFASIDADNARRAARDAMAAYLQIQEVVDAIVGDAGLIQQLLMQSFEYLAGIRENAEDVAEATVNALDAIRLDTATTKYNAELASTLANSAATAAASAVSNSNASLRQLGLVEDVLDTLFWLQEHASFDLTDDTSVDVRKNYFEMIYAYVLSESETPQQGVTYYALINGQYEPVVVPVTNPKQEGYYERKETYNIIIPADGDNPHSLGYYEISGIDETLQHYVMSHLTLTSEGLWITKDGEGAKLLISNDRLSFLGPTGQEVAYIAVDPDRPAESVMYITRSVIVKELRFGKFMWYDRRNNNMALKWVG